MDLDIVRGRAEGLIRALQRQDEKTVNRYLAKRTAVTPASVTAQVPDWVDQVALRRARVDDEEIVVWATCQGGGNRVLLEQHWIQEGRLPRLASFSTSTRRLPRRDLPGIVELPESNVRLGRSGLQRQSVSSRDVTPPVRRGDEHDTYPDDIARALRPEAGRRRQRRQGGVGSRPTDRRPRRKTTGDEHGTYPDDGPAARQPGRGRRRSS
jgi:hypothetical protein